MAALILNFRVVTHIVRLFGNEAGEDGKGGEVISRKRVCRPLFIVHPEGAGKPF